MHVHPESVFIFAGICIRLLAAVDGHTKNRHYHWSKMQPRHFPDTARQVGFSAPRAEALMEEMGSKAGEVLSEIQQALPGDFPDHIRDPILEGLYRQARRLLAG